MNMKKKKELTLSEAGKLAYQAKLKKYGKKKLREMLSKAGQKGNLVKKRLSTFK